MQHNDQGGNDLCHVASVVHSLYSDVCKMCVVCARFCTPKCSENAQNCTVAVYVFKLLRQEYGWEHFFVMALRDVGGTSKWRSSTQHMGSGKVQSSSRDRAPAVRSCAGIPGASNARRSCAVLGYRRRGSCVGVGGPPHKCCVCTRTRGRSGHSSGVGRSCNGHIPPLPLVVLVTKPKQNTPHVSLTAHRVAAQRS